ncbi:MAG: LolA family protein [Bdellovibrionales bacterium]
MNQRFFFGILFLCGVCICEAGAFASDKQQALLFLKKVLNKYQVQSIHFKLEKELFLPSLEEIIKEKGDFYIQKKNFRFQMNGSPSYLMIFDGNQLWYQPDTKEKIVFKLKDHPQIYFLFDLFDPQGFLQSFSIEKFSKKHASSYAFHLRPIKPIEDLEEVFIEVEKYIKEIKVTWKDLGQWQKYRFLNPWVKKSFPSSRFQFSSKNFEILEKESF